MTETRGSRRAGWPIVGAAVKRPSPRLAAALALLAVAPAGCTTARREVMLSVTTNIACPTIDRVNVRISRGVGATGVYTFNRTFALSGDNCSTAANTGYTTIPLGIMREFRLGVVDARRTSERVRIEVEATGMLGVLSVAETDFVDGKVYLLPMELATQCIGHPACPSGFTCRIVPGTDRAGCGSIYRRPGELGTFNVGMGITADEYVETDE